MKRIIKNILDNYCFKLLYKKMKETMSYYLLDFSYEERLGKIIIYINFPQYEKRLENPLWVMSFDKEDSLINLCDNRI